MCKEVVKQPAILGLFRKKYHVRPTAFVQWLTLFYCCIKINF